ncbi:hypothetical protein THAOC_20380, partial [Thalassiosira oceanica]
MEPHQRSAEFNMDFLRSLPQRSSSGLVPDRSGTDLSLSDGGTVVSGLTFLSAATPMPGSSQFAPSTPRSFGRDRAGGSPPAPSEVQLGGMAAIPEHDDAGEDDEDEQYHEGGGHEGRHDSQPSFSGRRSWSQQGPEIRPMGESYLGEHQSYAGQESHASQRSQGEQPSWHQRAPEI